MEIGPEGICAINGMCGVGAIIGFCPIMIVGFLLSSLGITFFLPCTSPALLHFSCKRGGNDAILTVIFPSSSTRSPVASGKNTNINTESNTPRIGFANNIVGIVSLCSLFSLFSSSVRSINPIGLDVVDTYRIIFVLFNFVAVDSTPNSSNVIPRILVKDNKGVLGLT